MDAEQTKPPGIASTSTFMLGDVRKCSGSSLGTTGRSFTTESSGRRCTRRARTTRPASFNLRSGVSKKKTCRSSASSGSIPSAAIVAWRSVSGTVSFSSTLSASATSSSIAARSSSESSWGTVLVAMPPILTRFLGQAVEREALVRVALVAGQLAPEPVRRHERLGGGGVRELDLRRDEALERA